MMEEQDPKRPVSQKLARAFQWYLTQHPPKQVNRHLREVFMVYISDALRNGERYDMTGAVWDIWDLMELLDVAEDETAGWPEW